MWMVGLVHIWYLAKTWVLYFRRTVNRILCVLYIHRFNFQTYNLIADTDQIEKHKLLS